MPSKEVGARTVIVVFVVVEKNESLKESGLHHRLTRDIKRDKKRCTTLDALTMAARRVKERPEDTKLWKQRATRQQRQAKNNKRQGSGE